jgi:hypothetical protein
VYFSVGVIPSALTVRLVTLLDLHLLEKRKDMSDDQDWSQWRTSVIDDCLSRVYIVACSGTVQVSSVSCMPVPLFLASPGPNADCQADDVCRIYLMRDANGSASVSLLGLAAASEQRARTADNAQAQSWHSCNCLRLCMLPSLAFACPHFLRSNSSALSSCPARLIVSVLA